MSLTSSYPGLGANYFAPSPSRVFLYLCTALVTTGTRGQYYPFYKKISPKLLFTHSLKSFVKRTIVIFSSPELMLRVSYCDHTKSVVNSPAIRSAGQRPSVHIFKRHLVGVGVSTHKFIDQSYCPDKLT